MSIKSQADWLRGFLESLEYSDNISQKQIQLLKKKLNLLLEEIEVHNDNDDDDYNDNDDDDYTISRKSFRPLGPTEDDLPF